MSYLDDHGNPCTDAKDDAAHTKQQVLAEIEKLLELIRLLDQPSESGEDTSYAVNAVGAMQAADRLQELVGIPPAVWREVPR